MDIPPIIVFVAGIHITITLTLHMLSVISTAIRIFKRRRRLRFEAAEVTSLAETEMVDHEPTADYNELDAQSEASVSTCSTISSLSSDDDDDDVQITVDDAADPPITILRPLYGLDYNVVENLESSFNIDWSPGCEVIFCVQRDHDPVIPVVRDILAKHPEADARLMVGNESRLANPKLQNLEKGWDAAKHDWICICDSNVLLPANYLKEMYRDLRAQPERIACVSSPCVGCRCENFAAELECAMLELCNRWQVLSDFLGQGYTQGKNMLQSKRFMEEAAGGFAALDDHALPCEDGVMTKIVRGAGKRVVLTQEAFQQPLGRKTFASVYARQIRWAKLRRKVYFWAFLPEIFVGAMWPFGWALYLAIAGWIPFYVSISGVVLWYGSVMALSLYAGWYWSWRSLFAAIACDFSVPFVWVNGWGRGFSWRGNQCDKRAQRKAAKVAKKQATKSRRVSSSPTSATTGDAPETVVELYHQKAECKANSSGSNLHPSASATSMSNMSSNISSSSSMSSLASSVPQDIDINENELRLDNASAPGPGPAAMQLSGGSIVTLNELNSPTTTSSPSLVGVPPRSHTPSVVLSQVSVQVEEPASSELHIPTAISACA